MRLSKAYEQVHEFGTAVRLSKACEQVHEGSVLKAYKSSEVVKSIYAGL